MCYLLQLFSKIINKFLFHPSSFFPTFHEKYSCFKQKLPVNNASILASNVWHREPIFYLDNRIIFQFFKNIFESNIILSSFWHKWPIVSKHDQFKFEIKRKWPPVKLSLVQHKVSLFKLGGRIKFSNKLHQTFCSSPSVCACIVQPMLWWSLVGNRRSLQFLIPIALPP